MSREMSDRPWPEAVSIDPLTKYGMIGDTRTAALCSPSGSIDWLCLPRFDGEPVFGRLVGGENSGHFALRPLKPASVVRRRYRLDSAVLETTWATESSKRDPRARA